MAARQPSVSFADRDASRSHGPMMTERDEGTEGQRLPQVWNTKGWCPLGGRSNSATGASPSTHRSRTHGPRRARSRASRGTQSPDGCSPGASITTISAPCWSKTRPSASFIASAPSPRPRSSGDPIQMSSAHVRLVQPDPFVPVGFEPPTSLETEQLRLEPLGPQHNEADLTASTSSIGHIRSTAGYPDGTWPPLTGLTPEENLRRHADDFTQRTGFTFTVLDPSDNGVIGCVYLYPSTSAGIGTSRCSPGYEPTDRNSTHHSKTRSRAGSPATGRGSAWPTLSEAALEIRAGSLSVSASRRWYGACWGAPGSWRISSSC